MTDFKQNVCPTCGCNKEYLESRMRSCLNRFVVYKQSMAQNDDLIKKFLKLKAKIQHIKGEWHKSQQDAADSRQQLIKYMEDFMPLKKSFNELKTAYEELQDKEQKEKTNLEATEQLNKQLTALLAQRESAIKKLKEKDEGMNVEIQDLKKELKSVKISKKTLLKKWITIMKTTLDLSDILKEKGLLPLEYSQELRSWKKNLSLTIKSEEPMDIEALSPDKPSSICSQDTGFDSAKSLSDDENSVDESLFYKTDVMHPFCGMERKECSNTNTSYIFSEHNYHYKLMNYTGRNHIQKSSKDTREVGVNTSISMEFQNTNCVTDCNNLRVNEADTSLPDITMLPISTEKFSKGKCSKGTVPRRKKSIFSPLKTSSPEDSAKLPAVNVTFSGIEEEPTSCNLINDDTRTTIYATDIKCTYKGNSRYLGMSQSRVSRILNEMRVTPRMVSPLSPAVFSGGGLLMNSEAHSKSVGTDPLHSTVSTGIQADLQNTQNICEVCARCNCRRVVDCAAKINYSFQNISKETPSDTEFYGIANHQLSTINPITVNLGSQKAELDVNLNQGKQKIQEPLQIDCYSPFISKYDSVVSRFLSASNCTSADGNLLSISHSQIQDVQNCKCQSSEVMSKVLTDLQTMKHILRKKHFRLRKHKGVHKFKQFLANPSQYHKHSKRENNRVIEAASGYFTETNNWSSRVSLGVSSNVKPKRNVPKVNKVVRSKTKSNKKYGNISANKGLWQEEFQSNLSRKVFAHKRKLNGLRSHRVLKSRHAAKESHVFSDGENLKSIPKVHHLQSNLNKSNECVTLPLSESSSIIHTVVAAQNNLESEEPFLVHDKGKLSEISKTPAHLENNISETTESSLLQNKMDDADATGETEMVEFHDVLHDLSLSDDTPSPESEDFSDDINDHKFCETYLPGESVHEMPVSEIISKTNEINFHGGEQTDDSVKHQYSKEIKHSESEECEMALQGLKETENCLYKDCADNILHKSENILTKTYNENFIPVVNTHLEKGDLFNSPQLETGNVKLLDSHNELLDKENLSGNLDSKEKQQTENVTRLSIIEEIFGSDVETDSLEENISAIGVNNTQKRYVTNNVPCSVTADFSVQSIKNEMIVEDGILHQKLDVLSDNATDTLVEDKYLCEEKEARRKEQTEQLTKELIISRNMESRKNTELTSGSVDTVNNGIALQNYPNNVGPEKPQALDMLKKQSLKLKAPSESHEVMKQERQVENVHGNEQERVNICEGSGIELEMLNVSENNKMQFKVNKLRRKYVPSRPSVTRKNDSDSQMNDFPSKNQCEVVGTVTQPSEFENTMNLSKVAFTTPEKDNTDNTEDVKEYEHCTKKKRIAHKPGNAKLRSNGRLCAGDSNTKKGCPVPNLDSEAVSEIKNSSVLKVEFQLNDTSNNSSNSTSFYSHNSTHSSDKGILSNQNIVCASPVKKQRKSVRDIIRKNLRKHTKVAVTLKNDVQVPSVIADLKGDCYNLDHKALSGAEKLDTPMKTEFNRVKESTDTILTSVNESASSVDNKRVKRKRSDFDCSDSVFNKKFLISAQKNHLSKNMKHEKETKQSDLVNKMVTSYKENPTINPALSPIKLSNNVNELKIPTVESPSSPICSEKYVESINPLEIPLDCRNNETFDRSGENRQRSCAEIQCKSSENLCSKENTISGREIPCYLFSQKGEILKKSLSLKRTLISQKGNIFRTKLLKDGNKKQCFIDIQLKNLLENNFNSELLNDIVENIGQLDNSVDVEILARCVLKRIQNDEITKLDHSYTPPAPPLTPVQQKLLTFIVVVRNRFPSLKSLVDVLLSAMEYCIINLKQSLCVNSLLSVTRFYAALCRVENSIHRVRALCYDALYSLKNKCFLVIYTVLTCYPEVIPVSSIGSSSPLCLSIISCIMNAAPRQGVNEFKILPLKRLLADCYGYKMEGVSSNLVDDFIDLLKSKDSKSREICAAITLLAKRNGPSWALKNLICQRLVPVLSDWKAGKIDEAVTQNIIEIVGNAIKPFPKDADVETCLKLFVSILHNSGASIKLKTTAALSLARQVNHNFPDVSAALLEWIPEDSVPEDFLIQLNNILSIKPHICWNNVLKRNDC